MRKEFTIDHIETIADDVLALCVPKHDHATVLALTGDLGAGKTTLTQALGKKLGVSETMISPTFVIMKNYVLGESGEVRGYRKLVHIDAYRLDSPQEMMTLGFETLLADPGNLIIVEWPERIAGILPSDRIAITLEHLEENKRAIDF
jgi:tRNA threonylcarbamoyladenosine biosynthesis protein TsaE